MSDVSAQASDRSAVPLLLVGLTGGIACGKSHATKVFAELGAHILDADQIAHEMVRSGHPAYDEIVDHFGREILTVEGEVDRKRLGRIIFADAAARESLNAIVHPRVIEEEARRTADIVAQVGSCIIIVDAALMVEVGYY